MTMKHQRRYVMWRKFSEKVPHAWRITIKARIKSFPWIRFGNGIESKAVRGRDRSLHSLPRTMYSRVWKRQGKSKTLSCSEEGNSSTSRKQRGNKLCRNPGRSFLRGGLHWPWSANMQVHLLKAVKCLFRLTNGANILYRLYSFTLAFCLGGGGLS